MTSAARLIALALLLLACGQDEGSSAKKAATDDASARKLASTDRIGVARSAAPPWIAGGATIKDYDTEGHLMELRRGTNGWLCLADDAPTAPGDSPDCADREWQKWFVAYENQQKPGITGIGVAYLLQGSATASNTDPLVLKPPPGAEWINDGPHVRIIVPDPAQLAAFTADPTSGAPYVRYKGTPYAYLVVPVTPR